MKIEKTAATITAGNLRIEVTTDDKGCPQVVKGVYEIGRGEEDYNILHDHEKAELLERVGRILTDIREQTTGYYKMQRLCVDHGYYDRKYAHCPVCKPEEAAEIDEAIEARRKEAAA